MEYDNILLSMDNNNSLLVGEMDTSEFMVENKDSTNEPLSIEVKSGFDNANLFESMASTSSDQNTIAQKTWELANNVETISTVDEIYRYDRKEQQDILTAKPWDKE